MSDTAPTNAELMRVLVEMRTMMREDSAALREHIEKDTSWMESHNQIHTLHLETHAAGARELAEKRVQDEHRMTKVEDGVKNRTLWGITAILLNAALAVLGLGGKTPTP